MTIRSRLTLWYAGILLVSLLLVSGWTLYEFHEARANQVNQPHAPPADSPLEEVGEIILYGGIPALALALLGGWFLMRRALAPVTRLTEAVERLHAGELQQQLPRSRSGDELDRLTEVFNTMTHRLHDSFQRIQEFTLHASHELNTPLTVMRAELETALAQESLSLAERERISNLLDEVERLTQIVESLAFLTKADAGLLRFTQEPVQLDELVREAFADGQVLGQPHHVEPRLGECEAVTVSGDRRRLRQLLLILTDNAVKYNHPGGTVALSLRAQDGQAFLTVTNTGPGIPLDIQGRVFDRFFRGDPSHNKDVDGSGLGLSIAKWIIEAHAGAIEIESASNQETRVKVRLPQESPLHTIGK